MSPPGRPKGEYRSAQREGTPVGPPGRPKGEYRSAQHEGSSVSAHLRVVCPHCDTINRVLRERLDAGANCGSCKQALLPGRPLELTAANFDRHVAGNDLPLVVDFWAPWCGPCRMMAPAYEQAAAQLATQARIAKLDTESEPGIATRFGIRSIPTLIVFQNGREVARQSGAMDLPGLLRWIGASA